MLALLDPRSVSHRLRALFADPQPTARQQREITEALDALDVGHYAQHLPEGPMTWEGQTVLESSRDESTSLVYHFSKPVEITGLFVSIRPLDTSLPPATAEDIAISLQWQTLAPSTESRNLDENRGVGDFVTASFLSSSRRLYRVRLEHAQPQARWRVRWKAGAGNYADSQISLGFVGRYLL